MAIFPVCSRRTVLCHFNRGVWPSGRFRWKCGRVGGSQEGGGITRRWRALKIEHVIESRPWCSTPTPTISWKRSKPCIAPTRRSPPRIRGTPRRCVATSFACRLWCSGIRSGPPSREVLRQPVCSCGDRPGADRQGRRYEGSPHRAATGHPAVHQRVDCRVRRGTVDPRDRTAGRPVQLLLGYPASGLTSMLLLGGRVRAAQRDGSATSSCNRGVAPGLGPLTVARMGRLGSSLGVRRLPSGFGTAGQPDAGNGASNEGRAMMSRDLGVACDYLAALASISAMRASTRALIPSRMGRTASTP